MVKVVVTTKLEKEVIKRLSKKEADDVFLFMASLEENPFRGDVITAVGSVILKELKHKNFRFYFIHSANVFKLLSEEELQQEILKFVAMSGKGKEQQQVINRIKAEIKSFGFDWF